MLVLHFAALMAAYGPNPRKSDLTPPVLQGTDQLNLRLELAKF